MINVAHKLLTLGNEQKSLFTTTKAKPPKQVTVADQKRKN
jgi:hypothetical protein